MNFSRLEKITMLFTALLLAFLSGWFLCRQQESARIFVPSAVETPVVSETTPSPAPSRTPVSGAERININTADAALLQTLPGIGEKRAADIVAYREAHGPFPYPESITDVPGIGVGTLNEIIDLITVEE